MSHFQLPFLPHIAQSSTSRNEIMSSKSMDAIKGSVDLTIGQVRSLNIPPVICEK